MRALKNKWFEACLDFVHMTVGIRIIGTALSRLGKCQHPQYDSQQTSFFLGDQIEPLTYFHLSSSTMPPKKPVILSQHPSAGRMTTRISNKDRIVGLPDMPLKRATKDEVVAKKVYAEQEKARGVATNLQAIKRVASIEDAQTLAAQRKDMNANHPVSTSAKCIYHRHAASTTAVGGTLKGIDRFFLMYNELLTKFLETTSTEDISDEDDGSRSPPESSDGEQSQVDEEQSVFEDEEQISSPGRNKVTKTSSKRADRGEEARLLISTHRIYPVTGSKRRADIHTSPKKQ